MSQRMAGALSAAGCLAVVLVLSGSIFAQDPPGDQKKPAAEQPAPVKDAAQTEADLRTVIKALADEVHDLTGEVRRLRRATEQNADAMQLVMYEDRLSRVRDEINAATARKGELDSSEQSLQYRLNNIQQELIVRGALNREDSEAAIRSSLQRSIQEVHSQQAANQKRLADLQNEEGILHSTIDELRRKLSQDHGSTDPQK